MYIYSQVDFFFFIIIIFLFYFYFLTLDCESMTTGHLSLFHMGYMSVCMLAHRQAWASLDVPCEWRHWALSCSPGTGAAPRDLPGRVAQPRTHHWATEKKKKNPPNNPTQT